MVALFYDACFCVMLQLIFVCFAINNEMITFEQFYLNENLFFNINPNGGHVVTFVPNTDLQLGANNEHDQVLICKFVGEYNSIRGDYTQVIKNAQEMSKGNSMVYIGYRSVDDSDMRIAAMAAVKGTANRLKQKPIPAAGYKAENATNYYRKEHYALEEADYNSFINRAIGHFNLKARGERYGVFVYPESRSKNAEDLCNALKDTVGADHAYVIPLSKFTINRININNIFDLYRIAERLQEDVGVIASVNEDTLIDTIRGVLLARYRGKTISTASDTRATHMDAIALSVCQALEIPPPGRHERVAGRLDTYTNPHYDIEAFLYDYTQHINHVRGWGRGETRENYAGRINTLTRRGLNTDTENQIKRVKNNTRVLFVDDNINSGDMYKQVSRLAMNPVFPGVHMDFFYLMCRETFAPPPRK